MSDDLLAKMTRALADEHDGATAVPEATRARVVRALSEQRPRRSKWLFLGVPALALLGGSTAFAAASGKLPRIVERAVAVFTEIAEGDAAPSESTGKKAAGIQEPGAPPDGSEEHADALAPEDQETEDAEPSEAETESAPPLEVDGPTAKHTPRVPTQQADESLEGYRAAHDMHVKKGNCEAAVVGYQKYLKDQPTGTFYLEAKYNLGVCLLRLGRTSEARAELSPFAQGKYGNYRKDRAQELLDALSP